MTIIVWHRSLLFSKTKAPLCGVFVLGSIIGSMIFVFLIFGLVVGSFLNVVLSRLPSGEQVFLGRSRCTYCKHKLSWYDLVPVLSFVLLSGRCRYCKKKISSRYVFVEAITAVGFVMVAATTPNLFVAAWLAVLWAISVAIIFYDIEHLEIPIVFSMFFWVWVAGGTFFFAHDTIKLSLLGLVVPLLFFGLVWFLSRGRWLGFGDVLLSPALGLWLGWPAVVLMIFLSYVLGAIVGTFLIIFKKIKPRAHVPFAPFLILGAWTTYLWGEQIIQWYLSLVF
jgi:prepilin signal peptidase PulO-like enzyme (type II secretory pathway)